MNRGARWWIKRVLEWLIFGFLLLVVLLSLASVGDYLVEFPFRLLFGWISFLYESLPQVKLQPEMILSGVAALVLGSVGLHFSARSLCAKMSGGKQTWSPRSSVAVVTAILLLFSVTLAGAGIVHQVGWLRSERWIRESYQTRMWVSRRTTDLYLRLQEWAADHDTYPLQLKELLETEEGKSVIRDPLLVQFGPDLTPEPWIFLAAGKSTKLPSEKPLVISPRPDDKGRWVAVFSDRRMAFLSDAEYQMLMALPDSEL